MTTYYPSLFSLHTGRRLILLDAGNNDVHQYLPPPAAATRLVIVAVDVTNTVDVRSSTKAPLGGSATEVLTLEHVGDCLELIANRALTSWVPLNHTVVMR